MTRASSGPIATRICGHALPREILQAKLICPESVFHYSQQGIRRSEVPAYGPPQPISVHFHVLTTGVAFKLVNVTRTVNETWFNKAGPGASTSIQTAMKTKLRVGGVKDLNIYTVGGHQGLLGYSTFPVDYEGNPTDDGVVVSYASLPGGSMEFFNLGRTITHEVGHWLGLYHPFEGMSCEGQGDQVEDTPPQSTPTNGCPETKDSCKGGGVDSIHNFMDYAYDSCMNNFTPGQVVRMKDQLATYRNITL
ncbi:hypothetical protein BDQ17DRAFT_1365766 [Cyathus striatus]|nr:hypothetical protein BDQ17DRAFT_1365766 [Cyathus striatus]